MEVATSAQHRMPGLRWPMAATGAAELELELELGRADGVDRVGLDVGGSLVKVCWLRAGEIRHAAFEIEQLRAALEHVQALLGPDYRKTVCCTGGGAQKFSATIRNHLCYAVQSVPEVASLVAGLFHLLGAAVRLPALLVNVGSGAAIVRVDGPHDFSYVSGSAVAGGTFRGLASALAGEHSFAEMLRLAAGGTGRGVDLLVSDIYGADGSPPGLLPSTVASFFGALGRAPADGAPLAAGAADLLHSLLLMVCRSLAQVVFLNAALHHIPTVYLAGGFLASSSTRPPTVRRLTATSLGAGHDRRALRLPRQGHRRRHRPRARRVPRRARRARHRLRRTSDRAVVKFTCWWPRRYY